MRSVDLRPAPSSEAPRIQCEDDETPARPGLLQGLEESSDDEGEGGGGAGGGGSSAVDAKPTREKKLQANIIEVRQRLMEQKQMFWKMVSESKIKELTDGKMRPGYLAARLQGANTQAEQNLKDIGLAGTIAQEAEEQRAMSEAVAVWKTVSFDNVPKKHHDKYMHSMVKHRAFKALVACLPWTAICQEKQILVHKAISDGTAGWIHLHVGLLKADSPSLSLCTPADLEQLQLKIVRAMVRSALAKSQQSAGGLGMKAE